MTDVDLTTASHQSFIGSYRVLAEHVSAGAVYDMHDVFAFKTGARAPIFNGCIALDDASEEAFGAGLDWLLRQDVPCSVWIHAPAADRLDGVARAYHLVRRDEPYPGMALHPIPEPPPVPGDIAIELVEENGEACLYAAHAKFGRSPEDVDRFFGPEFRGDPDVRMFCIRLDGEPVGTSIAIRTGDVGGVYAVGTAKEARKRGVGTAATWAAIDAARDWGCHTVVLQSSTMALSIYRRMGFEVVAPYVTYVPEAQA